MELPLYERVALRHDIPEIGLKQGDIVTTVEYLKARRDLPSAFVVEAFNAVGETMAVFTVPATDLEALTEHDVLHKRVVQNKSTDSNHVTAQESDLTKVPHQGYGFLRNEQESGRFETDQISSGKNAFNKSSDDPLDKLIFEQSLRIKKLFFDTELDLMLVLLTNGRVLNLKLSGFPRLRHATAEQLASYELEDNDTAVSWELLGEDLSVKGFIKQAALEETLYHLAKVA